MNTSGPVASGSTVPDSARSDAEPARKRQRRKPIACLECRRRKSKCDRQLPCSECVKRGEANLCQGGNYEGSLPAPSGPTQPLTFALPFASRQLVPANAAVVESLAKRVQSIELLLGKIASAMPLFPDISETFQETLGKESLVFQTQTSPVTSLPPEDGLEDAVKMLEQAAFDQIGEPAMAQRSPSNIQDLSKNLAQVTSSKSAEISIWQQLAPTRLSGAFNLFNSLSDPLSAIVGTFPPISVCRALIAVFIEHVDINWHYVHRSTFNQECELFWATCDSPDDVRRLDPAWLALFANAMARGAKAVHYQGLNVDIEENLYVHLYSASQLALTYAEWTSRPQARVLQTLIGAICLLPHSGSPFFADPKDDDLGGGEHGRVLIGVAVSLARRLRLDHLTQEATPETHPILRDASFPFTGPSSLHTELGRRWWWSLVSLDAKSCIGRVNERHIAPGSFSTPLPSAVMDESLGQHFSARLEPANKSNDADPIRYQAYLVELIDETPETAPTYEQVLALDALWRPRFLDLLGFNMGDTAGLTAAELDFTKGSLVSGMHARLLRIHRPYFLQGLRDERFTRSSKTCVTCAHIILAVIASPRHAEFHINQWWSFQHVTSAVLIIVLGHIHRVHQRGRQGENDEGLLIAIKPALDFFARGINSSSKVLRTTARQCLGIVNLLCQVAENGGGDGASGAEHMVELLKHISQRAREKEALSQNGDALHLGAATFEGGDVQVSGQATPILPPPSVPFWLSPQAFGGVDDPFSEEMMHYLNSNLVDLEVPMDSTVMGGEGFQGDAPNLDWLFNS